MCIDHFVSESKTVLVIFFFFFAQVSTIPNICDAIIIHDVLHKRKALLDSFAEGLEVFHLKTAISAFPEEFQDLFVATAPCSPEAVLDIVQMPPLDDEDKTRVASIFKSALTRMSELGEQVLVKLTVDHCILRVTTQLR